MLETIKVVFTDDEPGLRDLVPTMIENMSKEYRFSVEVGTNERDLVALTMAHKPDFIVTDNDMPHKYLGFDALKQLRQQGIYVPAIVCSGDFFSMGDAIPAKKREITNLELLDKPFSLNDLILKFHKLWDIQLKDRPLTPQEWTTYEEVLTLKNKILYDDNQVISYIDQRVAHLNKVAKVHPDYKDYLMFSMLAGGTPTRSNNVHFDLPGEYSFGKFIREFGSQDKK